MKRVPVEQALALARTRFVAHHDVGKAALPLRDGIVDHGHGGNLAVTREELAQISGSYIV
jgi:hypothetical protein